MAKSGEPLVRREAVMILVVIVPPAKDAIPVLEGLLRDRDVQVATRAKAALASIRQ